MKKRIITGSIAALVVVAIGALVWYQWPVHLERTYDHVALWYAMEHNKTTSDFVGDATTINLSITKRRKLTAPDIYSGTITIGGRVYTVSAFDHGGVIQAWGEKAEEGKKPFVEFYASIEEMKKTNSGVILPSTTHVLSLYMNKDFESFYCLESIEVNSRKMNAYAYPATNKEEAQRIYDTIRAPSA